MEASKILLFSPISTSKLLTNHSKHPLRKPKSHQMRLKHKLKITSMAKDTNIGIVEKAVIAGGLISSPVVIWSIYTLKTTGCGLPPGPGGSVVALEVISYLGVVGIAAWFLYTNLKTGSVLLPNSPFGLLDVVDWLVYLILLADVVLLDQGYIPGLLHAAPWCFG